MRTEEQIRTEMQAARQDMIDLLQAAFFGVKGRNPIYNKILDKIEAEELGL